MIGNINIPVYVVYTKYQYDSDTPDVICSTVDKKEAELEFFKEIVGLSCLTGEPVKKCEYDENLYEVGSYYVQIETRSVKFEKSYKC